MTRGGSMPVGGDEMHQRGKQYRKQQLRAELRKQQRRWSQSRWRQPKQRLVMVAALSLIGLTWCPTALVVANGRSLCERQTGGRTDRRKDSGQRGRAT